jgi:hypothetical protein
MPLDLKLIKIWTRVSENRQGQETKTDKLLRNFFINKNLSRTSKLQIFNINNKSVLE